MIFERTLIYVYVYLIYRILYLLPDDGILFPTLLATDPWTSKRNPVAVADAILQACGLFSQVLRVFL